MEEERIFERMLVFYYLRNVFVLVSLGSFWFQLTSDNLSPFYRLQGRVLDTSRKIPHTSRESYTHISQLLSSTHFFQLNITSTYFYTFLEVSLE